jgi:hypothetical protein
MADPFNSIISHSEMIEFNGLMKRSSSTSVLSDQLTQILRLDIPIIASSISGGLKHNTHSDHGIVF